MTTAPVSAAASASQSAFGLDFQSLLQIILQQLQYQDPLKPMDNFEFVSQLAQFSQLEQTQTLNTSVTNLLTSQASMQAVGIIGKTVGASTDGSTAISGTVTAVSFANGVPSITIQTSSGQVVANLSMSEITQVQ